MEIGDKVEVIDAPGYINTNMRGCIGVVSTIISYKQFNNQTCYKLKGLKSHYVFERYFLKIIHPTGSWANIEEACGWNPYKEKVI